MANVSLSSNCTCYSTHATDDAGDATWILTSAFIIFTMQSGFGLLESGSCSSKSQCNVMVKNAVDIIFGALGYYICGYALSFQDYHGYGNGFTGVGVFLLNSDVMNSDNEGHMMAHYFFQLSFATTATTIVSGAMTERTNLKAYMLFSFLNLFSYVFPAHWVWSEKGFLKQYGVVDITGCGPVHIVGGAAALVATLKLKSRTNVFSNSMVKNRHAMASPTNVVLGTFMLWWGWLGFNCGSTFGVSGGKWKLASKASVITINGSVGGGIWGILYSYYINKDFNGKLDVSTFTSSILSGLVSITGICAICQPWEALIIGSIGGMIGTFGCKLLHFLKVDDPVNCIPIHLFCGLWGMVVIGLVGNEDHVGLFSGYNGILKGGSWKFLGFQLLGALVIALWSIAMSFIQLTFIDKVIGLRISLSDELRGSDFVEHGINDDETCSDKTLIISNQSVLTEKTIYPNNIKSNEDSHETGAELQNNCSIDECCVQTDDIDR